MRKLFFLLLFVTGCTVGPDYKKEEVKTSSFFLEKKQGTFNNLKFWWKIFKSETLDGLIEEAILNNYDLKIVLEKIEGSRAFYRIKKADLFPEINLSSYFIRSKLSQSFFKGPFIKDSSFNYFKIGFDAIWEIDLFGKKKREKETAFYKVSEQIEDLRDVYITLISDIAKNYIDICSLKTTIDIVKEKRNIQKTIVSLVQDKTFQGLSSEIKEIDEIEKLKNI